MKRSKSTLARGLSIAAATVIAMFSLSANAQVVFPVDPEETITLANGDTVEVYKATVLSAHGNRLTVRFPHGVRHTYQVPSDYMFELDGRKVHTRNLSRGDQLTAYVTHHATHGHQIHFVEETDSGSHEIVSSAQPEPVADALPSTASAQPLLALLGVASLGLAFLFFGVRRRVGSAI